MIFNQVNNNSGGVINIIEGSKWSYYYGNNYNAISAGVYYGGHVSFKQHLGKPLTDALWEDLVYRVCIKGLCIYKPNMDQWCIGWGEGHCIILLDNNDLVEDIQLTPHWI